MNLEEKIQTLEAENAMLRQHQKELEEKVLFLLQLIEKQNVKKDSHNSHNPPSQDKSKPKRNQGLRKKSNRKPGGQIGHKGHTLEQKPNPDKSEDLKSDFCECCGEGLNEFAHTLLSKRQVVELPPIQPLYVEYRQYGCLCLCGHHQKAAYPKGVNAPIQYGSEIVALVSYFSIYLMLDQNNCSRMFFTCPSAKAA